MLDLVVVGGGPAGLHTAARCAEAGLDTVVFEEHGTIGEPVHCTGIISLETAEFVKIPDDIILSRLNAARLTSPGGEACDFTWDRTGAEEIVAIDRGAFDRSLADKAVSAGARIETGARVDDVIVQPGGVSVLVRDEILRARACVLACGTAYRFQRRFGAGVPGQLIHTAQLEVDAQGIDRVHLYVGREVAPEGFVWMVPLRRNGRERVKIGVMATRDPAHYLQAFLGRSEIGEKIAAKPGPLIRRLLPLEPLPRTYAERVLMVGDAAGLTKPTTGGGIFYSIVSASIAASTMIEAFQADRFDAEILSRYERSWQARLAPEFRVSGWLRRAFMKSTDLQLDRLVRVLRRRGVQRTIDASAHFNWHRPAILALLHVPGIASLLRRAMFR